jgi:site-specific recombinase XerD
MLTVGRGTAAERLVRLHPDMAALIAAYELLVRPELARRRGTDLLFPTRWGARFTRQGIWRTLLPYGASPSVLRHTAAARMIVRGADDYALADVLGVGLPRAGIILRAITSALAAEEAVA